MSRPMLAPKTVPEEPDPELLRAGYEAYWLKAGGSHYGGMDGIRCAYCAMAKILNDRLKRDMQR